MRPFFMSKIRRIVIMDLTEKLNLVGYFEGESKQLKSVEEVAEFICKNGKRGDVTITNDGEPFITTIGIYLDMVADIRYRAQLMPILTNLLRFRIAKPISTSLISTIYACPVGMKVIRPNNSTGCLKNTRG